MIKLRVEEFDSRKKRFNEIVAYDGKSVNLHSDISSYDNAVNELKGLNYEYVENFGRYDDDGTGFEAFEKNVGDFRIGVSLFDEYEDEGACATVGVTYTGKNGKKDIEELDRTLSALDMNDFKDLGKLERMLISITNESVRRKGRRSRLVRESKEDTVYVVFRKERKPSEDDIFYGNDVTAFIYGYGIPVNYGKVMCYQHVGQHGEASLEYYNSLKPASPDEYADLLEELKSIYDDVNLVVRKKLDYNILSSEWRR